MPTKPVFVRDLLTDSIAQFTNLGEVLEDLKMSSSDLSRTMTHKKIALNRYLVSYDREALSNEVPEIFLNQCVYFLKMGDAVHYTVHKYQDDFRVALNAPSKEKEDLIDAIIAKGYPYEYQGKVNGNDVSVKLRPIVEIKGEYKLCRMIRGAKGQQKELARQRMAAANKDVSSAVTNTDESQPVSTPTTPMATATSGIIQTMPLPSVTKENNDQLNAVLAEIAKTSTDINQMINAPATDWSMVRVLGEKLSAYQQLCQMMVNPPKSTIVVLEPGKYEIKLVKLPD